ncbi:MAG: recombinase family protein [Clostridia bacterium]
MKKTCVIYARFSSHTQTEQSIDGQLRECHAYAERNELNIIYEYIDRAISGTTDKRPLFQQMIEDSKKKQFDYVLVYQLDRFARNRYDSATYKTKLKKNGVRVISAKENISDDASGILMEAVLEGMAEYYSSELGQKVKRGIKESMSKGNFIGGSVNLGYKIENKKWVIDESESNIVKDIFNDYYNGIKGKEIADKLNNLNYKTKSNKHFDCNAVSKIIRSTKYKGEITHDGKVYRAIVPAIVDKHLWNCCNEMMDNVKHRQTKGNAGNEHILSGKLYCGNCGGLMTAESGRSKNGPVYYYYKCYERKMHRNNCNKKTVRKDWIENLVVDLTKKFILKQEIIDEIANKVCEKFNSEITQNTLLINLEKQMKEIDNSLNQIVCAITNGIISYTLQDKLNELEKEKQNLQEQILNEKANQILPLTPQMIKTFLKQYDNVDFLSNKQKKEFFTKFIKRVILYDNKIIIIYNTSRDPQKEIYFKNDNFDGDKNNNATCKGNNDHDSSACGGKNNINKQIQDEDNSDGAQDEFKDKNKADSNMLSAPSQIENKNNKQTILNEQEKTIKKDCREFSLQSDFGGEAGI